MAYFRVNSIIMEALQYDPANADGKVPEGITVKDNIARAKTPAGIIYVYPTDWIVYDMNGDIRCAMKHKNFLEMYSQLGTE